MSFVKRADGITYNVGGHYMSRGTLEQVKYGSAEEEPTPQEENWLKEVTAALMTVEDSLLLQDYALDGWMDQDNEVISRLWGTYHRTCPHVRRSFNEDYFWPDY
jgi:hypothetical protein